MAKKVKNTTKKVEKNKKTVIKTELEVQVYAKGLQISPRKLRLIANGVSKLSLEEAEKKLIAASQKAARIMLKTLRGVIANAVNNSGLDKETLKFKQVIVEEAPGMVRRDRFHGARFNSGLLKRRRSHLKIVIIGQKKDK